jgi:hypothetical protein
VLLLFGLVGLGLSASAAYAQDKKPNILFIMGDDIGVSNVSAYSHGMMGYQTPNIDSIAKDDLPLKKWLNNRAENSHQPFRRREGAMAGFRDIKTLQKFASVHASIHNHLQSGGRR